MAKRERSDVNQDLFVVANNLLLQEKVVEWLNTMRLGEGGFISTVDTVVALQALVLYSYHSRINVRRILP